MHSSSLQNLLFLVSRTLSRQPVGILRTLQITLDLSAPSYGTSAVLIEIKARPKLTWQRKKPMGMYVLEPVRALVSACLVGLSEG